MDDVERIKFEKIDGKIKCAKKVYQQFIIRGFDLSVTGLTLGRTYNNEFLIKDEHGALVRQGLFQRDVGIFDRSFDQKDSRTRLYVNGTAKIDKDSLGIIGDPENSTEELDLTFEQLDESSEEFARFAWKANIFFLRADWELDTTDSWYVTIYVPTAVFRDLVLETEEKRPHLLSLRIDTDLWAEESDQHMPPAGRVLWYLAPNKDGRLDRMPENAHGVVTSMSWSEKKEIDNEDVTEPVTIKQSKKQKNFRELINALYVVAGAIFILAVVIYWKQ